MTECEHVVSKIIEMSRIDGGIELFVECGKCHKEGSAHFDFSDIDNTNPWWED